MNFLMLPSRLGSSVVSIVGIACVVAVFIGLFAIAESLRSIMNSNGDPLTLLVLRQSAENETNSSIERDTLTQLLNSPLLLRDAEGILASPETTRLLSVMSRNTGELVNINARGVTSAAWRIRPAFKVVEGRLPASGRNELLVGRAAQSQFAGLELGATLRIADSPWEIVGVFENAGSAVESELWTDLANLQSAFGLGSSVQSLRVKLADPTAFEAYKRQLESDPLLNAFVQREQDYYERSTQGLMGAIRLISLPLVVTMALGAVFAALNTMYSAVASRTREIATLRAIGFASLPIGLSVLLESMLLAGLGALLGVTLMYFGLDGYTTNTSFLTDTQFAFSFVVSPALMQQGVLWALLIGFLGGLAPAIRGGSMPIVLALRNTP